MSDKKPVTMIAALARVRRELAKKGHTLRCSRLPRSIETEERCSIVDEAAGVVVHNFRSEAEMIAHYGVLRQSEALAK